MVVFCHCTHINKQEVSRDFYDGPDRFDMIHLNGQTESIFKQSEKRSPVEN